MQTAILTFIIPIISMIFTCAFLALWWNDRKQWPVLAFAGCFGSLALGVGINIWMIEHVYAAGAVAYHLVSMTGVLALMWGVAKRAEVKAPILFCSATVLAVSVILWIAIQMGAGDAMRLAQNTNSALVTAAVAGCLWYGTKRNWADHALMWVLVALASFGFVRPVLTILFNAIPGAESSGGLILNAIHILVIATLLTMIALCLITSIVFGTMEKEREHATTDPLTGLANRGAFEEKVKDALERAKEENASVSLLVGDIDNFKSVNDTWGHSAGDKVITTFGSLISRKIRPSDLAGRVGGEEFCLLIWDCSEATALSLGNRLRLAFANSHISGFSAEQRFTVSFGVTQWRNGEGYEQVFARADQALYAAKRAGRNRVEASSTHASPENNSPHDDRDRHIDSQFSEDCAEVVSLEKVKAGKSRA